ncbi:cutinase [Microthyrium microscopicum]|uniref:cutinase n=1 Tax=Microthyrium microscopicum TaxID=703497 RepID=A0A6A6U5Z4_9PEZI|nr:cutinase [Microthyrium microscopicum]
MKLSTVATSLFVGAVVALPQGSTSNDLAKGCKKVTLVYARASTEIGNMGTTNSVGPGLCKGLKANFANDVACQGVSSPAYTAGLIDNFSVKGTTASAIAEATKHFTDAATRCPQTIMVAGGFSQGTAVIFNAVGNLPDAIKKRVVGVALYGYTKNKQNGGTIPKYPKENVKVFCPASDGVCGGTLNVNLGHFSYLTGSSQREGYTFLTQKIKAAGSGAAAAAPAVEAMM